MLEVAPDPENRGRGTSFRNQVQKPAGILPKNAQTWVIAGLSAVMIAAIAISGNGSKNKSSSARPREAAVIDPNAARITEYRNRLEEEAQRLTAEQAQLNQAKHALGVDQRPILGAATGGLIKDENESDWTIGRVLSADEPNGECAPVDPMQVTVDRDRFTLSCRVPMPL